ncbi:MAG: homoserine dehydrogenase [Vampirovibrionales bacterium]
MTSPKQPPTTPLKIGMIGLGTVGQGTYKLIQRLPHLEVVAVAVQNLEKERGIDDLDTSLLTLDAQAVAVHPDIDILIEVAGGVEGTKELLEAAIQAGKHVVTANKALIAQHGPELFALAKKHDVSLLFEAAVAGGVPIVTPLKMGLASNQIEEIAGILNGTTNYILTRMMQDGWTYEAALDKAKALGYAEADPSSDVEGFDAAYKIAILAGLATGHWVNVKDMTVEGITPITPREVDYAKQFGYTIRLVALARLKNERPDVRVHPMLVPNEHPLSSVHNEYNAIWVRGDAVGDAMFSGKGAGELPTASSVMGDVLAIVADLEAGNPKTAAGMILDLKEPAVLQPIGETTNRYYIRMTTADEPGVLAALGTAFGDAGVSLESFLQLPNPLNNPHTSLMVVTHIAQESSVQEALSAIRSLASTQAVDCVLRVL